MPVHMFDPRAGAAAAGGRAAGLARTEALEVLVRRLLDLLGRITGIESTYLTRIDVAADVQEILYARNHGALEIPEGLEVEWSDTLCRRALDGGPACTADVAATYPDSAAAAELGIRTYVTVPVRDATGGTVGTLCGASTQAVDVDRDGLLLMEALAEMVHLHLAAESAVAELERLAMTDPLTRIANRRMLDQELDRLCSHASRHGSTASLLVIDVDRFKLVNDTLGHDAGDALLVAVADALVGSCRSEDVVGRWGGDEFVVLLPDTDADGVASVAERVRSTLASLDEPIGVSIGAATGAGTRVEDLLVTADAALYAAKAAGRGRVEAVRLASGRQAAAAVGT